METIDKTIIESLLTTKVLGRTAEYFDEIDSTNNRCKVVAKEGAKHGLLVIAERQSAGRGRRERSWETPYGTSIAMSFLLRPNIPPDRASILTLVAAVAIADGISKVTALPVNIKWPNDIVINGRKVCGILTEMSVELSAIDYVVVGIGINVNNEKFSPELSGTATSLFMEKGERISREQLICAVLEAFEEYYELFIKKQDLAPIKELYESYLVNRDKEVFVLNGRGDVELKGVALGIDDMGRLRIRLADGEVTSVMAGEVSVRGMNGYV